MNMLHIRKVNLTKRLKSPDKSGSKPEKKVKDSRSQRRKLTDTIKMLVEYACLNGSNNSKAYYMIISKLINKIAQVEDRKTASTYEMAFIEVLESATRGVILKGIEDQAYYKDIYKNIKRKLEDISVLLS
jgi:hypothetical protein